MHAVRRQVLEILKTENNGSTVAELAEKLAMAPVSVRHHLDILQGDNLICVQRIERKGQVGRPQQIYALTAQANSHFPNNFAALAGTLARQIKQVLPSEQVEGAFRAMAHEIASEFVAPPQRNVSLESHLEQVTGFLNERGYLAQWEVTSSEPGADYLLHKHNCPYCGVAAQHVELCVMDQAMIDEVMGQPCQRTQTMVEGATCCTYRIVSGQDEGANAGCATPVTPISLTMQPVGMTA
jgi:predicted ArsR family transcriptional regulator